MSESLVTYFSASGTTAKRAEELAKALGADLYEIVPKEKYTATDLDWTNRKSRTSVERDDPACRPALEKTSISMKEYDRVYVGFPIWWYTAPRIINSFLEENDFGQAEIILFATSGGSGIGKAVKDLQKAYPGLRITEGKLVNGGVSGLVGK
ncbi:flavodoxin [uncultured Dialister sp.]|jgi:menaquinone-dependent protoporphyrinogen IX oxidase|uniref:flavodoxin n=1 Tax=Dialister sp. TaxID=1955814 RepID=UPI0025DCB223|nr:flavodoxin [uncultured Dialister sp.]